MSDYWLGVLTIPAIAAALWASFWGWLWTLILLEQQGVTFTARWNRDVKGIGDYTLRRDVWWERSFGPVFVGGWYHEKPTYDTRPRARFNRWVGVGRANGPCLEVIYSRDLGEVAAS